MRASASISPLNFFRDQASLARCWNRTLTTTLRPASSVSVARYVVPNPPRPSSRTSTYRPLNEFWIRLWVGVAWSSHCWSRPDTAFGSKSMALEPFEFRTYHSMQNRLESGDWAGYHGPVVKEGAKNPGRLIAASPERLRLPPEAEAPESPNRAPGCGSAKSTRP